MSPGERERRAIQPRNTAERRAANNGTARRASGQAMIERRTGKSDVDDINALVNPPRQQRTLHTVEPRGAQPAQRGTGNYVSPPAANTGGGIASPLTEKTRDDNGVQVPDRDYWPTTYFSTTDGLLLFEFRPTQVWRLTDADGGSVEINVARPKSATRP